jgi:hypothetical protein
MFLFWELGAVASNKRKWGARSPDNDKIVAMAAEINNLKGQLKLAPKLAALAERKDKDDKKEGKMKQNKKDRSNKKLKRKMSRGIKCRPRKKNPRKRNTGTIPFHWCKHHMAWTIHKPDACLLGKQRKEEQQSTYHVHTATVAAATTTTAINPHYAALLATLGDLIKDE